MKVEWSEAAREDRRDLIGYLETKSLIAAERMDGLVSEATRRLVEFPKRGRAGRVPGTRELVIQDTPYIAVYRVDDDIVLIVSLLHAAQQWPPERPPTAR